MTTWEVVLHTEQSARVVVQAPDDADDAHLTEMAMLALDKSGGAEWETVTSYTDTQRMSLCVGCQRPVAPNTPSDHAQGCPTGQNGAPNYE